MKYIKPNMVDCGKSESIIKGDCDWGGEGWVLDRTGSYHKTTREYLRCGIAPGFKEIWCCSDSTRCDHNKDLC